MRKRRILIGLIALVTVTLLLAGLLPIPRIAEVSAMQWIGANLPWGVAIGDYNDDGLNDIAIAEEGGNRVTVYKSDFSTIIYQWTGLSGPAGVAIGDYDNDGRNELAFAETGANRVTVYKNDLPTPTQLHQFIGLNYPVGVAIGDYNNDGLNDLAFTEYMAGKVTVYESDFSTIIHQWTLGGPVGVAIGDYNNDGRNDIGIADIMRGSVTVYRNDVPSPTVIYEWTGLHNPIDVAIGDYNNDGLNDLAFTESSGGNITVYKSDFTTIIQQWAGLTGGPYGVAIGDYNNDGLNDLAFAEMGLGRVTTYFQTKQGTAARVAEPTIVTLRGTLTDNSGYPIVSGSIRVTIKDSLGVQLWQDVFDNYIDNGKYNLPLGTKTTLKLIKGQIYNAILEVDAYSATFVSADVTFGDNNPVGDLIKFVAD